MSFSRRRFLYQALIGSGLGASFPKIAFSKAWGDGPIRTPSQTSGPFYPVPEISKQAHYDADLTRLDESSPAADGEQVIIRGSVVDLDDHPLAKVVVEVWQACATGRYNHPQDRNERPIDPNFQYWARMLTSDNGQFSFRTIQPGKYPGRTPHIHFRIAAPGRSELTTQMYFENQEEHNRNDGLYMDLQPDQRRALTVAMESRPIDASNPASEKLPTGNFQIVLGPLQDAKTTRPM
jgi:protocatechuate 3,4-dioxygenase beta subunit